MSDQDARNDIWNLEILDYLSNSCMKRMFSLLNWCQISGVILNWQTKSVVFWKVLVRSNILDELGNFDIQSYQFLEQSNFLVFFNRRKSLCTLTTKLCRYCISWARHSHCSLDGAVSSSCRPAAMLLDRSCDVSCDVGSVDVLVSVSVVLDLSRPWRTLLFRPRVFSWKIQFFEIWFVCLGRNLLIGQQYDTVHSALIKYTCQQGTPNKWREIVSTWKLSLHLKFFSIRKIRYSSSKKSPDRRRSSYWHVLLDDRFYCTILPNKSILAFWQKKRKQCEICC